MILARRVACCCVGAGGWVAVGRVGWVGGWAGSGAVGYVLGWRARGAATSAGWLGLGFVLMVGGHVV